MAENNPEIVYIMGRIERLTYREMMNFAHLLFNYLPIPSERPIMQITEGLMNCVKKVNADEEKRKETEKNKQGINTPC